VISAAVGTTAGGVAQPASASRPRIAAAAAQVQDLSVIGEALGDSARVFAQSGPDGKEKDFTTKDTKRHKEPSYIFVSFVMN
jgi:hypothetical protein